MRASWPFVVTVAALLTLGAATAAVTFQHAPSTVTTSAAPAPLTFAKGAQGGDTLYVRSFSLSTNKSTFSATLRGVPQATVVVPELATLKNALATTQTVVVTAPSVTQASITTLEVDFLSGSSVLATLDLRAGSPSASFTIGGGSTVKLRPTIGLAEGAGSHNVAATLALTVATSG